MGFQIENGILKKYTEEDESTVVTIPDEVRRIGDCAFWGCQKLTSVIIPESVLEIGREAFFMSSSLNSFVYRGITFPFAEMESYPKSEIFDMIVKQDFRMKMYEPVKYAIICRIFRSDSENEAVNTYIKENFTKIFKYLIDKNDIATIEMMINSGKFLKKRNIDKLIDNAIQKGANEIYVMLVNYKNEHFGFADIETNVKKRLRL